MCHSAPSVPVAKASNLPSELLSTQRVSLPTPTDADGFPDENQVPQLPPGVCCQMCHSAPPDGPSPDPTVSGTTVKASMRPSAFLAATGIESIPALGGLLSEAQVLHSLPGVA